MTAPRVKLDIDTTREKLAALGLGYATSEIGRASCRERV